MPRFTVDPRRWMDVVVPQVLAGRLDVPRWEDEAPMRALVAIIRSVIEAGVVIEPHPWQLTPLAVDDEYEGQGLVLELVRRDAHMELPISASWDVADPLLPAREELEALDALDDDVRAGLAAILLREAIEAVLAFANDLLEQRFAQRSGCSILRCVPETRPPSS